MQGSFSGCRFFLLLEPELEKKTARLVRQMRKP
jgi:hypothetical protein